MVEVLVQGFCACTPRNACLKKRLGFIFGTSLNLLRSVTSAEYLCDRDFRLDNVLVDNKGVVKIADFGHSKTYTPGWDFHSSMSVGAIHNLSPQQIAGQLYSGEKIDMWSTGVAICTLLVGPPLVYNQDTFTLLLNISTGSFEIPDFVSGDAADLIRYMIRVVPSERLRNFSFILGSIPVTLTAPTWMTILCLWTHFTFSVRTLQRPSWLEPFMSIIFIFISPNPKSSPEDLRGQD